MAGFRTFFVVACVVLTAAGCISPEGTLPDNGLRGRDNMSTLLTKARESGSVRVIVRLRVTGMPAGAVTNGKEEIRASPERDSDLEQQITEVAESVLKGLSGTRHRVYRRYASLPLIAIEASPAALEVLASMHEVDAITEDTARPVK